MNKIISILRQASTIASFPGKYATPQRCFSVFQNITVQNNFLSPSTPLVNQSCGFKVKGRVRRRCKSCYFVVRDERLYVICPEHPRHKQMAMKAKPLTTYVLTHASQSKIRPW